VQRRILFLTLAAAGLAAAHPMGNFSVSHYTQLNVSASGLEVTYILNLAEIPTYQLLRDWKLEPKSPAAELDAKAEEQARQWMRGLEFRSEGKRLEPAFERATIQLSDGDGGLTTARITSTMTLDSAPGSVQFEDHNYPERTGWKEIVIHAVGGAAIVQASQSDVGRSKMLTAYPADPEKVAPQDLRASVEWRTSPLAAQTKIVAIPQPAPPPSAVPGAPLRTAPPVTAASNAQGNDYLAALLGKKEIGLGLLLIGMAVAFGLGAVHALSPGHGKTIVAAYLVGSRGTMSHAVFLGAMVTFTHTISVFAIGLGTFFLSRYIVTEKIIPILGAVSGLSIVAIGAFLFFQRLRRLRSSHTHDHHHHDHDHGHTHEHAHAHTHDHDRGHTHDHAHVHDHDHDHAYAHAHGIAHSHVPEGEITMGSLIALGASGGLVPCPSALVLLLSSIALGHIGAGLILLVAFSFGLAGVLMAIGMLVLYAKNWLPDPQKSSRHPAFRLVPVLSAFVIFCVGLLMTGVSLGWVHAGSLVG
jgi:nickel/cobalt transporter (NicO) family protein